MFFDDGSVAELGATRVGQRATLDIDEFEMPFPPVIEVVRLLVGGGGAAQQIVILGDEQHIAEIRRGAERMRLFFRRNARQVRVRPADRPDVERHIGRRFTEIFRREPIKRDLREVGADETRPDTKREPSLRRPPVPPATLSATPPRCARRRRAHPPRSVPDRTPRATQVPTHRRWRQLQHSPRLRRTRDPACGPGLPASPTRRRGSQAGSPTGRCGTARFHSRTLERASRAPLRTGLPARPIGPTAGIRHDQRQPCNLDLCTHG